MYALDVNDTKQILVDKFSAKYFNTSKININEVLQSIEKLDCIIDTTGNMNVVSAVLPALSENGKVVIVSLPKIGTALTFTSPNNFFLGDGQTILSTQGGKIVPSVDFLKYINLYKTGKLDIDSIITHTFDLININAAVDVLRSGVAGRVLINTV